MDHHRRSERQLPPGWRAGWDRSTASVLHLTERVGAAGEGAGLRDSWRRVIGRGTPAAARDHGSSERRPFHSVLTGFVALVAVVAIVLPLALTGGSGPHHSPLPAAGSSPRWAVPPSAVRWASVEYPITGGCGSDPVQVQQASVLHPPGGPQLAIVLVRCRNAAELPASSLFAYDGAASPTRPLLRATLLQASQDEIVAGVLLARGSTVTLPVAGYSTPDVPQCCPDVHATFAWAWAGGHFERVR